MKEYIESLNWRYAAKKYDAAKKVSKEDLETLKQAVRLSVSSVGLQPYKVFVVESDEMRNKLKTAAGGNNQNIIADSSYLFVFANELNVNDTHVDKYISTISQVRDVAPEAVKGFSDYISGYLASLTEEQKNIWTAKQSYIALSTLINTAALLRIDATPMEGFDAQEFNKILGLDELGLNAAVIAAVGYRHEEDAMQHAVKVRKPLEELFVTV
ncbi:NAD(P)H-dependent oxidoreductase [Flavobacterium sp. DG1-102-2]|uniref:NAD(P)H-dependent oxidoreductase n=1 Tax=Flavobacterium sp. DG1-102-2 TaxID=3081663 RepID=UPI00294A7E8B|nr:NAD(P)H-dependent oxidoreductase [Flavobacterium sp. DG1-102-2]MDV6168708.1 NAD(P)H-dependent oxidoreductase [Flavobacterium sp. DG1-102-2]